MEIRTERQEDWSAVEQITGDAFGEGLEVKVVQRLRVLPEYIPELSLVAEEAGEIVGHVILSTMHHENPRWEGRILGLGPISVARIRQRQGIGTALMREAIARSRELGFAGIVLLGHPTYYPRFGFLPASGWGIDFDYDVPDDVAMAVELREGSLAGAAGRVTYSAAFRE